MKPTKVKFYKKDGTPVHFKAMKTAPLQPSKEEYVRGNCPFCDSEHGFNDGWGFSLEGWEEARKAHKKHGHLLTKEEPESKEDDMEKIIGEIFYHIESWYLDEGDYQPTMEEAENKVMEIIHSEKKKSRQELLTKLEEKLPEENTTPLGHIGVDCDKWNLAGRKEGFNSCLKQIRSIINLIKC
jgi:hypothetical protein